MTHLNTRTIDGALAALIEADSERVAIQNAYQTAQNNAAKRFERANETAQKAFDAAGAEAQDRSNQSYSWAKGRAEALMADAVEGFEAECEQRGVSAAASFGSHAPRTMAEIGQDVSRLDTLWPTFDLLNEVERAALAEPKPIIRWVWLGVVTAGTVALFVLGMTAG